MDDSLVTSPHNSLHPVTHPHKLQHTSTETHTYHFSCSESRWIHTSQLSPFLHTADPDLQPHVGVLQVRPKTVLHWGNHHIQRHPPEHTLPHACTHTHKYKQMESAGASSFRDGASLCHHQQQKKKYPHTHTHKKPQNKTKVFFSEG